MGKQLLILCLCLSSLQVKAQQLQDTIVTDKPETIWQMAKYDAKSTIKSVGHSFTRPLHWKGKDFEKFAILLGGTAALTFTDNSVRAFALQNKEDF